MPALPHPHFLVLVAICKETDGGSIKNKHISNKGLHKLTRLSNPLIRQSLLLLQASDIIRVYYRTGSDGEKLQFITLICKDSDGSGAVDVANEARHD